jgi:hypothetical protein
MWMLRQTLAPLLALFVCVAVFVWIESFSSSFQSCINEQASHKGEQSTKEHNGSIAVVISYARCTGRFVNEHDGGITALATIIIAAFTGTIWAINWNQLAHAHKVERAYISGGGGYGINTSSGIPTVDTTQFILTVQNYGKTQGTVTAYAVFVIDRANLPPQPAYLTPGFVPTPFSGIYQLGGPTLPITQTAVPPGPNPIAYGRLWYKDIFGGRHHFSFALPIRTPEDHASLVGINPAYTEST